MKLNVNLKHIIYARDLDMSVHMSAFSRQTVLSKNMLLYLMKLLWRTRHLRSFYNNFTNIFALCNLMALDTVIKS